MPLTCAFAAYLKLGLLIRLEAVGVGQQPAGDLAAPRDRRGRVGRVTCLPEWPHIAADGLLAAADPARSRNSAWSAAAPVTTSFQHWCRHGANSSGFDSRLVALASSSLALPSWANCCTGLAVRSSDAADRRQRLAGIQWSADHLPHTRRQAREPAAGILTSAGHQCSALNSLVRY